MDVSWCRASAYVVCRDDAHRLLLTQFVLEGHPDSGSWTLPGGGMEWGEAVEDTAERELHEETGLTVELGTLLGVYSEWLTADVAVSGEAGHLVRIVFSACTAVGELRTNWEDGGTTADARWFELAEVEQLKRGDFVDWVLKQL
jgi:ADP-ribose pyrophosphatase YjhB (NUDIX family)